ncbi:MAG TPA: methylenetetrahydrofolate reductase [NAD(P)H] [Solirubrobacteraceae bacterium]|nr:methylenetetrahydrofolate reductase [NAD(P)H] [Solirubrobacteraceae bacterium]
MRIDQILATRTEPVFSFEFFPPKTEQGARNLDAAVRALRDLDPAFVSVTKTGASTQAETIELVRRIRVENDFEAAAHFTCAGATREELRAALDLLRDSGLENVLALRGDPPRGEAFAGLDGGFVHASDLVEMIRSDYDLCTVAACYPETHPEAQDAESDLAHLCRKVAAGASVLITNLFFSNAAFFDFERRARAAGITVPIVPGIMPITKADQIKRFTAIGGITIPPSLLRELDARGEDTEAVADLGVAYSTLQCAELLAAGAPGIHFYTLNRSPATRAILSALRLLRPWDTSPI